MIEAYLTSAYTAERLQILQKMRENQQYLPISLSADLMKLKLNAEEHIAILRCTSGKHKLALEDYLSSQFSSWDQNVAGAALWEWALRTDCIMGHRALPLSLSSLTPQRLRYTLLDLAWFMGGLRLVQKLAQMDGLSDMSPAFLSLLSFRALQFGVNSKNLLQQAKQTIQESINHPQGSERTSPYFMAYVYRFDREWARSQACNQSFHGIWTQFLRARDSVPNNKETLESLKKILAKSQKKVDEQDLLGAWPSLWDRECIDSEIIQAIFEALTSNKLPNVASQSWEFFAGLKSSVMFDFLMNTEDTSVFCYGVNVLASFLDYKQQGSLLEKLKLFLQKSENPSEILTKLSPRYSALLNTSGAQSIFGKIFDERQQMISAFERSENQEIKGLQLWEKEFTSQDISRHNFFALAYHGRLIPDPKGDDFWDELALAWKKPTPERIETLSLKARQAPDLYQICFIDTLGRFKGNDAAALKLLDFIRTGEEPVLRSVIYALYGIGTVRATQELVSFLTRPNVSPHLQIEISQLLKETDVSHLQAELRSALNDLNYRALPETLRIELRDSLQSLLTVSDMPRATETLPTQSPTTVDLDKLLTQKIKGYDLLSSEVKRALRTAQFFHLQVEQAGTHLGTIDLSPAIDMQYKALELCFREKFEQPCGDLIKQGILQRKLDVIGYARPIPSAMDDFEMYIENLPIINTIPFFSRFKLRKMLRAICQFRPGKRFTLDGLKAFAIFFICFSRNDCRFGLGQLFPINNLQQDALLHFCKDLHVFQDFRNRAAHEGFHPDASNNLDSIWKSTASIIENMFLIAESLETPSKNLGLKKSV